MRLRVVAAVAVLVSAAVHFYLWGFEGYRALAMVGPAFLVNAVAGVVIAVALLAWRHWLPLLLCVGFGASTLGAFVISATVGLFGVHEQWRGFYVWAAALAEVVAIVTGLLAARSEGWLPGRSGRQPQQHVTAGRTHLH